LKERSRHKKSEDGKKMPKKDEDKQTCIVAGFVRMGEGGAEGPPPPPAPLPLPVDTLTLWVRNGAKEKDSEWTTF
jgi:hypothetical protein